MSTLGKSVSIECCLSLHTKAFNHGGLTPFILAYGFLTPLLEPVHSTAQHFHTFNLSNSMIIFLATLCGLYTAFHKTISLCSPHILLEKVCIFDLEQIVSFLRAKVCCKGIAKGALHRIFEGFLTSGIWLTGSRSMTASLRA